MADLLKLILSVLAVGWSSSPLTMLLSRHTRRRDFMPGSTARAAWPLEKPGDLPVVLRALAGRNRKRMSPSCIPAGRGGFGLVQLPAMRMRGFRVVVRLDRL
jgi:hypothetical protein